jgi:hypothetical protein
MKLYFELTYIVYIGLAVLLYPVKNNNNSLVNDHTDKVKKEARVIPAPAKAEISLSGMFFKF